MKDYAARRYEAEQKKRVMRDRTIKELKNDLNLAHELNAALTNQVEKLDKQLKDYENRYNKECYNVVVNNDYVTKLIKLPAYRSYLPLQEVNGIDMNKLSQFMETPLYAKIPFIKLNGRTLKLDTKQYKKFLLGGIM